MLGVVVCPWIISQPVSALQPIDTSGKLDQQQGVSATESGSSTEVYRIVGLPTAQAEFLPKKYLNNFSRWHLNPATKQFVPLQQESKVAEEESCKAQLHPQAGDAITVQPTLNIFVRNAIPSYVAVGLSAKYNPDSTQKDVAKTYQNHLAQQWISFSALFSDEKFKVEVFLGPSDGTDDFVGIVNGPQLRQYVNSFVEAFTTTDHLELGSGFHMITLFMEMSTGNMQAQQNDARMLTCLASSVSNDAKQLLSLTDEETKEQIVSKLCVEVEKVLSG